MHCHRFSCLGKILHSRIHLLLLLNIIAPLTFGLLHLHSPRAHAQTIPPTQTIPPQPSATATTAATATATTAATPDLPPLPILISELMADPRAVNDRAGEWLELYNPNSIAVNLRNWTLADLGTDRHTITQDVVIEPDQYLVLARNFDTATNGGVSASYLYANISLANSHDELLLFDPRGREIDRVQWGEGTTLTVQAGVSLQRTTVELNSVPAWVAAGAPWLGSDGDAGTPGGPYLALPAPTPTVADQPTATPVAGRWPLAAQPSALQIDEVFYSGSDSEFVVLVNAGRTRLSLAGWLIGDEESPGQGEGIYALPVEQQLAPGQLFIIARSGAAFRAAWGRSADAEFEDQDPLTPSLSRRTDLASGQWALNNSGDEVLLLNPAGEVADLVVYGNGTSEELGVSGFLRPPGGYTLQRVPDARFPLVADQRHRFLFAPPAPFTSLVLPQAQTAVAVSLPGGLHARWGSLGAQSTFGPAGSAPPHYLLAASAAAGLDFVAIADATYVQPWSTTTSVTAIPAWQWQGDDGTAAVVYHPQPAVAPSTADLLAHLQHVGAVAQWLDGALPSDPLLPALAVDTVQVPDSLHRLAKSWQTAGRPLLPAGNSGPTLPGAVPATPRYTGLAVADERVGALHEAIAARRGWITNRPGLWLAMQLTPAGGTPQWMGSTVSAQNSVTIRITYGDRSGELAALALWRDGRPIQQLDLPVGQQRWEVSVPALPNSLLYAVATQADGDFAVTAPVYVLPATDGRVVLNEVLPAPWGDYNGDGEVNTDDEFIELYNPSDSPLSLAGWQLLDAAADNGHGRAVTLGTKHVINAKSWLLLFRNETYLSLNNEAEHVRLLDPTGTEVDRIAWAVQPGRGATLGRLADGGEWAVNSPTPGSANVAFSVDQIAAYPTALPRDPGTQQPQDKDDDEDDDDENDLPPPVQLDPTHGQAGGPPASVAQSKLAGLEAAVEFYGVVTAPPGLFNATIYVADPAPDPTNGPLAGIGINVYLRRAGYPPLQEGDRVRVRGTLKSFRGELELQLADASGIWRIAAGRPLAPLPIAASEVGETLEGRLVTFQGVVSGWQGDSIYLRDPAAPERRAVRVTVRSSTGWRRPYVNRGELWEVTGIVSQFAWEEPWNGGYRVLARYQQDLQKLDD